MDANLWEDIQSLDIVSKRCHFYGNLKSIHEKLLNW